MIHRTESEENMLQVVVSWALDEEPEAVAVLLAGSRARGEAQNFSDVDITTVTTQTPKCSYRTLFLENDHNQLTHVSMGAQSLQDWQMEHEQPVDWSMFLPAEEHYRVLWVRPNYEYLFSYGKINHPAPGMEVEDFLEYVSKAKNAWLHRDDIGVRWSAMEAAKYLPGILKPLNPEIAAKNKMDALKLALSLPVTPENYQNDMMICLGLIPVDDTRKIMEALLRLALGAIKMIKDKALEFSELIGQPYIPEYIYNGTVERYLLQGIDDLGITVVK